MLQKINQYKFDLVGLQNISKQLFVDLLQEKELNRYSFYNYETDVANTPKTQVILSKSDLKEWNPILYNKENFEAIESGHFWLSRDPAKKYSKNWQMIRPRFCNWVKLQSKTDKKTQFYVFNTHFDQSKLSHVGSIDLVREHVDNFITYTEEETGKSKRLPCILLGNFNSISDHETFKYLISGKYNFKEAKLEEDFNHEDRDEEDEDEDTDDEDNLDVIEFVNPFNNLLDEFNSQHLLLYSNAKQGEHQLQYTEAKVLTEKTDKVHQPLLYSKLVIEHKEEIGADIDEEEETGDE